MFEYSANVPAKTLRAISASALARNALRTSRLETKLDNETAREEGADQGWLAAGAGG